MAAYYILTIQPDEPVELYFATQDEYETVLDVARKMENVSIDEEQSGAVQFIKTADAIQFLKDVWGS